MTQSDSTPRIPHVVIVGGGFGGLYTAQGLGNQPVRVTIIDKRNFHLFQPLLYQVATGSLSPGDIAAPLRSVVRRYKNTEVLLDEVIDIAPDKHELTLKTNNRVLSYDMLVLATGSTTHFFGNDQWAQYAFELKTLENALDMRRRILSAFEEAERETDPEAKAAKMTFVIVGGGPTGVELAGAVAELARYTLKKDFRHIDSRTARIILLEASPRVLAMYPESLSQWAAAKLGRLGVTVRPATSVTDIREGCITIAQGEGKEEIKAGTVLWAAGVKASALGKTLADKAGCEIDRGGRLAVAPDLSLPGHGNIFVIGDLASYTHTEDKRPLPGVAPVAMQEGRYVAKRILAEVRQDVLPEFIYRDKGNLAVVSFTEAVASIGKVRLSGFIAWLIWAFVHVFYLIEFDSKLLVLLQWAWTYFTRKRSARLITGSYD